MDERIAKINIMLVKKIREFSSKIDSKINFDYDLKKSNWFNIGGKTKVYFKPNTLDDLILFLKKFGNEKKIYILGAGSNTLISDNIFDGIVIKLGKKFSGCDLTTTIAVQFQSPTWTSFIFITQSWGRSFSLARSIFAGDCRQEQFYSSITFA